MRAQDPTRSSVRVVIACWNRGLFRSCDLMLDATTSQYSRRIFRACDREKETAPLGVSTQMCVCAVGGVY